MSLACTTTLITMLHTEIIPSCRFRKQKPQQHYSYELLLLLFVFVKKQTNVFCGDGARVEYRLHWISIRRPCGAHDWPVAYPQADVIGLPARHHQLIATYMQYASDTTSRVLCLVYKKLD